MRTATELLETAKRLNTSLSNVDQNESKILNELTDNREDFRTVLWLVSTGKVLTITVTELEEQIRDNKEVRKNKI